MQNRDKIESVLVQLVLNVMPTSAAGIDSKM